MPGQPAWTLTEMLECNLPLCWAGGGDCKVGPAQKNLLAAQFMLFSLKPIRAICFMGKHMSSRAGGRFFWSSFSVRCEAAWLLAGVRDFFLEQKRGHAGRFFWSRKSAAAIVLLQ